MTKPSSRSRAAGYAFLVERHGIEALPNWHRSEVSTGSAHRVTSADGVVEEVYPARYWPGDSLGAHLEFALKYDGTNLGILEALFRAADADELTEYIRSRPTGKYARRLWFLYEFLTGVELPLPDLTQGNYVDVLEPERYYTPARNEARRVRRQRVHDNLLGARIFCPTVRRTDALREFEDADLPERCREIVARHSPDLLKRAMSYLYTKETRSSFEIEHEKPSPNRVERFVALLWMARRQDFLDERFLVELHNLIVDDRFRASGYRTDQIYVGQALGVGKELVHFAGPRPEDVRPLMDGLTIAHGRMELGGVPAVVHAAVASYGFVFIHPFDDGNGRIHRFLIHNVLARRGFTPKQVIFPVSAAMLNDADAYDASLEAFSRPLMSFVDYRLDEDGAMTVLNDTARHYRYLDMTPQVEALYRFIEKTVDEEFVEELTFLAHYDESKAAIQEIVDLPDREIDRFIRFCLQNHGRLTTKKRNRWFGALTDEEVRRLEQAVRDAYELQSGA